VRNGLRYLTDEAAAIDPDSFRVDGLAKSLTINAGSWGSLPELEPVLEPAAQRYVDGQWHVDVRTIREDAVAVSAEPGYVIVPRYAPGARTKLAPLSRPRALLALCENAFNLPLLGQTGLDAVAEVVRRSSCYQLVIGDLPTACNLVFGLLADTEQAPATLDPNIEIRDVIGSPTVRVAQTVGGSFVPVPRASVASVAIEGEAVVLEGVTGAVHHLDALGSLIWACFDGAASVDELAVRLSDAFAATPDRVREDISEFVRRLGERDLLESNPSLPGTAS
jgi:hypothetical protein